MAPPTVTMANGMHVVQVAVDPDDGRVLIERHVLVHDCGRIINPKIVTGQVHGATVQGIGEARPSGGFHARDIPGRTNGDTWRARVTG